MTYGIKQQNADIFIENVLQTLNENDDFSIRNLDKVCKKHHLYNSFDSFEICDVVGQIENHIKIILLERK